MPKKFILIESDPIVAIDLEGTLRAHFSGCAISIGTHLSDVSADLAQAGHGTVVFVKAGLFSADASLAETLRARMSAGARIVIIGAAQPEHLSMRSVDTPFTTEMILSAIEQPQAPKTADEAPGG